MDIKTTSDFRPRQKTSVSMKSGANQTSQKTLSKSGPNVDTFESSAPKIFGDKMLPGSAEGLIFEGPIPSSGTLTYYAPDKNDGIDWERVEKEFFSKKSVTLDNADSLMSSVDHTVSMYVAVKHRLEQNYRDDEEMLTEKIKRLDAMFDKAKKQLCSSYQSTVGHFYEGLGNKGVSASMGASLSAAIDRRAEEMEEIAKNEFSWYKDEKPDYIIAQISLEVWALNQREEGKPSKAPSKEDKSEYSLEDLEAAGIVAKAASQMKSETKNLMSEEELGIYLASQYMKISCMLGHSLASEKMSDMILKSFETFLSPKGQTAKVYQYALKQYEDTNDIKQAIANSGKKYLKDSFFSDIRTFGNHAHMTLEARYNFDINQFLSELESRGPKAALYSISRTGIGSFSSYA